MDPTPQAIEALVTHLFETSGIVENYATADFVRYTRHNVRRRFAELIRTPRSHSLTPWSVLLQPQTKLDTLAAIIIEELVATFGWSNCDFAATLNGCSPLLFAVRHWGPKTAASLCYHGRAQFVETDVTMMDDIAVAPVSILLVLAHYMTRPRRSWLNRRVRGGGTALHAVCRTRPVDELKRCVGYLIGIGVDPTRLNDDLVSPRQLLLATRPPSVDRDYTMHILEVNEMPQLSWPRVREVCRLPQLPPELSRRIARHTFAA